MTIEQKAKAYEDALKRAKAVIKVAQNQKEVYGCITTIFPELEESNDEKVIKALIRFHKSTIDIDGIKGDDIIAWLEKQKGETLSGWWVARDVNSNLYIYFVKPVRNESAWDTLTGRFYRIPKELFPDLKWEDMPIKVDIIIKKTSL